MVTGEEIAALVGEPLPAFEPEGLVSQFKRAPMNEEHPMVCPLHGHGIENGEERGIAELLVPVRARRIAAADHDTVKVRMVVVPENRDKPALMGQRVDLFKGLLWPAPPVEEVSQVDEKIDRPECLSEYRCPDAGRKRPDRCNVSMHIGKDYCTHTVRKSIGVSFQIKTIDARGSIYPDPDLWICSSFFGSHHYPIPPAVPHDPRASAGTRVFRKPAQARYILKNPVRED
jgi:hypothetical protein